MNRVRNVPCDDRDLPLNQLPIIERNSDQCGPSTDCRAYGNDSVLRWLAVQEVVVCAAITPCLDRVRDRTQSAPIAESVFMERSRHVGSRETTEGGFESPR